MENEEKVMGKKRQFHELKTNSNELSCDNIEPVKAFTNTLKAWRDPPIKSPNKSVIANLQRKICNKVLAKSLLQIVAKINPFFTTATGDKTATTAAAEIWNALSGE